MRRNSDYVNVKFTFSCFFCIVIIFTWPSIRLNEAVFNNANARTLCTCRNVSVIVFMYKRKYSYTSGLAAAILNLRLTRMVLKVLSQSSVLRAIIRHNKVKKNKPA